MRVLIVDTSEIVGGAAVAANRLMEALNNNGVKAKMLVRDKQTDDINVAEVPKSWRLRWNFLWERFVIFCRLRFKRDNLFLIDIANAGVDITKTREFKEADVVHLSWINQGMLSLGGIRRILESNPWCGRCTTCGRLRPYVIMHATAADSKDSAATVRCCPEEGRRATYRLPCGAARDRY